MIITVSSGDTLFSISNAYGVPIEKIISDNGINGDTLVIGQSLIIDVAENALTTSESTTADLISQQTGIESTTLFRNNFILGGRPDIPRGTYVVLSYRDKPEAQKIIGGYAYDFISTSRLSQVINYLTYIIPFTYGFTEDGSLVIPDDTYILERAKESGVMALMHVSTLTPEGNFNSNLPSVIFSNTDAQSTLIDNIILQVTEKGYDGVDVDFEYLPRNQRENYVNFISVLSERLHELGKILIVALPPKTDDEQEGLLFEGIDYAGLGQFADYTLLMVYEYGYRFGPPLAIAPVNQIRKVLDYAVTRIPSEKLLLGLSNYGYDWTLPYVRGESDAPSISTVEAIELAKRYGAEIRFDELSQAPFFNYTDENGLEHEVWFEDARSFAAKLAIIDEYGLPGGFIWELNRENPQGYVTINSLVKIT